ncbi:aminotransferase class I/II-fold pyridoxal phosphate-dependent enzyme [Virgisporangium aurantiacum]|uniref:GntR family transcriptional regulator n=1 Tax=Virgisporangium aurantiacum TaxID=175570 RepID=A0A8J3YWE9_9ACTN|nr:aminotransferase class I/II-fold pyridoxal phosphate-dependent enzyme [Virgisporangium aurantiacum]GIJ52904.1 GntR family transcriptional regulator [Virgisporangium aurantiacum]
MAVRYQFEGSTAAGISVSVEFALTHGHLAPGESLPPVRQLAEELGVSPNTVAAAYRQLRDRGLVETAGRNGTRVRHRPPVSSRLAAQPSVPAGVVDLSAGEPDRDLLPDLGPALQRIATRVEKTGYSTNPLPELLENARPRLGPVPSEHLTVTAGALDGLERILTAHLRAGDRIAVEDPGWAAMLDLVAALGLHPLPVRVDDDGPDPEGLEKALRQGAKAVVITSRAQNPTGAVVSAARAADLRAVLAPFPEVLVIEDDHAAELAGEELQALAGTTRRWAFLRSSSKPFGPDLRLAVLAGDATTVARVEGRMRLGAGWVSTILQRIVVELWSDRAASAQIQAAKREYAHRRLALIGLLRARGVEARARSGVNVWVPVADETYAVTRLRDAGFAVAPGALYRVGTPPAVRISIGPMRPPFYDPLADALVDAVRPSRPVRQPV